MDDAFLFTSKERKMDYGGSCKEEFSVPEFGWVKAVSLVLFNIGAHMRSFLSWFQEHDTEAFVI